MADKIIGYRGLASGELILYLSRIFYNLGLKVLICDYSPDSELEHIIPLNEEIGQEGGYINYRGIKYTKEVNNKELLNKNDVVLINFGFLKTHKEMSVCNCFHYITDMNKINIDRLSLIQCQKDKLTKSHLLIKDVVYGGIAVYAYVNELMDKFSALTCHIIKLNKRDIKIKTLVQYNDIFKFDGISNDLYNYLSFSVYSLYSDIFNSKNIKKAVNAAMKGK